MLVLVLGLLYQAEAIFGATFGMPPFMVLSPPKFKAGHLSSVKLMMFTENTGNISLKYYNNSNYYSDGSHHYSETILSEHVYKIGAEDTIIDIPVQVPESVQGSHYLKMSGFMENFGAFEFDDKYISITQSGYKTYVQTDKPIYKPGQPVRFRGFSIDSALKGLILTDGLTVKILNPDNIEVFNDVVVNDGGVIHHGEFHLAEEAKIGEYTINVHGKNSVSCYFSVEEYVLPKFGVEIEGPGQISVEDKVVKGKISATYTYGKPLNGKVTLKFAVDNKSQRSYSGPYLFKEIDTVLVEGKADWQVDIEDLTEKRLKYLFNPWCTPSVLVVAATVSNEDGGASVEAVDSSTTFSQSSLKLTFGPNTQNNYAAGFPYFVEIDVASLGLKADETKNIPIKLTMISGLMDLKYDTKEVFVNDSKVFATFDVPEDACAVKITAEINIESACDAVFACFQPERMVSKSDEFIRFYKTEQQSYRGGETMSYKVLSKKRLDVLHFVMLSKGDIVKSWNLKPQWRKHTSGKFIFEETAMIPHDIITRSRLVVLTANSANGFILADAIDICIEERLLHELDLKFTESSAKPGQPITITLTSDPASFVGISVTDASLSLLRKPCKVLTKDSTLSFLRGLEGGIRKDLNCKRDDPYQCESNTEVKIIDVKDLLKNEGLTLNTNMNVFDYVPPVRDEGKNRRIFGYGTDSFMSYTTNMEGAYPTSIDGDNQFMREEDDIDEDMGEEDEEDATQIRNFFPESWLWTDTVSDDNGETVLSVEAPDTITGWKGRAFGLSPTNGLGFSNEVEFQTFLQFFISLALPYSGTVGERISIPVRVFNYKDVPITAVVSVSSKLWEEMEETVYVLPGKATTVIYTISLTEAGNHEILVKAKSDSGESDAVEKSMFVQPGGEKVVDTSSVLIMKKTESKTPEKAYMLAKLPESFIPGSHKIKMVAVGDILGEAASGISNLIQLPSGCGEQNMHKIAINVFSANYLRSLYKELPENIDYNIKHNLNIGLQQQLAYRKGTTSYSNGYSVFKEGLSSDWLTAFVHRIVKQFPKDVFVPCDTVKSDSRYLMTKIQAASWGVTKSEVDRDGWAPYQYSAHEDKQLYWQSYLIISLLEEDEPSRCGNLNTLKYNSDRIARVCNSTFEMANVYKFDDCCYHHMVAYSVELCKQRGFLNRTEDLNSPFADKETCLGATRNGHYKFVECGENLEHESVRASSKAIEASGYAAIYLMSKGKVDDALPLIMWLASQRNENGGFRSSQDTVIGLQALSRFAGLTNAEMIEKTDLVILIGKGSKYFDRIRIKDQNKLSTKEVHLQSGPGKYKIRWTGYGTAFVQLISTYHISSKEYENVFMLEARVENIKGLWTVQTTFKLPENLHSTMFLLEVSAPTGLVFVKSVLEGQMQSTEGGFSSITRYDIKEGGQRLQLYVDPYSSTTDIELNLPLYYKFTVTNRMPAQISLVDYYNPSLRQTIFYSIEDNIENNQEFVEN